MLGLLEVERHFGRTNICGFHNRDCEPYYGSRMFQASVITRALCRRRIAARDRRQNRFERFRRRFL